MTTSWLYMICTYLAFLFLECGGHGGDGRCPRRFQGLCIHSKTQSKIQALETSFQCTREQSASLWSLITIEKALLHTPCACRDWSPMVQAWHILQRISEHTDLQRHPSTNTQCRNYCKLLSSHGFQNDCKRQLKVGLSNQQQLKRDINAP